MYKIFVLLDIYIQYMQILLAIYIYLRSNGMRLITTYDIPSIYIKHNIASQAAHFI